jgi:hypothetical protein
MRHFLPLGLFSLWLCLVAAPGGLAAQEGVPMVSANLIIYPWLPPSPLPDVDLATGEVTQVYDPVSVSLYYGLPGNYGSVTARENQMGRWFHYQGPRQLNFYSSEPSDPEVPPPVLASTVLPSGARNILLIMAPGPAGGYRLLSIPLSEQDFLSSQMKVVNFGKDEVVGLVGKTKFQLPAGKAQTYEFPDDSRGSRVSFAYRNADDQWRPFFDSYVSRPRGAVGMLFVHSKETEGRDAYAMRRIVVPAPPVEKPDKQTARAPGA